MFCVTINPMRTWLSDYVAKVAAFYSHYRELILAVFYSPKSWSLVCPLPSRHKCTTK